jgi:hypothetical protein
MILLVMVSVFLTVSCSNERRLAKGKPLKKRAPSFLVNHNAKGDFQFDGLSMKISVDVKSEGESDSFKANIRIRKDSVIWISISPALGVEMVRVIITPDSVKYVSKVPYNKHYYLGDFTAVTDVAMMDLDFKMIQDILLGNAIMMDKGEDKFVSLIDKQSYCLISKFNRHLRRVLDFDEKSVLPNSTFAVNSLSKEYQKALRRASVDDLMVKRFWLDGSYFRVEQAMYNDLYNMREIEIQYDDFEEHEGQLYPEHGRLKVTTPETWTELDFKVIRLRTSKTLDFPFTIPEDYELKK